MPSRENCDRTCGLHHATHADSAAWCCTRVAIVANTSKNKTDLRHKQQTDPPFWQADPSVQGFVAWGILEPDCRGSDREWNAMCVAQGAGLCGDEANGNVRVAGNDRDGVGGY